MDMLIRKGEGPWRPLEGHGYTNEALLQQILADHPELVPGVPTDALVCTEWTSDVGRADLLMLAPDGRLTVVECKLAANPQVRREVIGQVLDYASRLWRTPIDEFEASWVRHTGSTPFGGDQDCRDVVADNLASGRFALVLAVDAINDELKRIVEYLNHVTAPETTVVAVEYLRSYDGDVEILRPRSYGTELAAAKRERAVTDYHQRRRWTVEDVLDWCDENDPEARPAITALIEAWEALGWTVAGGRAAEPSLNVAFDVRGAGRRYPFIVYAVGGRGLFLEVRITDLKDTPSAGPFASLAVRLPGMNLDIAQVREVGFRKRPRIPLAGLSPDEAESFVQAATLALSASSWIFDDQAVARLAESPAWLAWWAKLPLETGEGPLAAAYELADRMGYLWHAWACEEDCRADVMSNHGGGLPVEVAQALIAASSPVTGGSEP